ncbi:hypothetical protein GCM10009560_17140 [Nonomuraea longicatena]|uniref:Uncharacterized protein n=1 Tax=Nonomuraea longicatena TaxID=83682 RepID=A0ABP3ZG79_9ACTN
MRSVTLEAAGPVGGWRAGRLGREDEERERTAREAPARSFARLYRYWPVLATVSMDRPASVPCLPETSVRM